VFETVDGQVKCEKWIGGDNRHADEFVSK